MAARELKIRWTEDLIGVVLKRLRSGEIPDVFGYMGCGRCDLRGFVIREILREVSIADVDLSGCSFERAGQFLRCRLTNVDLSRSSLKTNIRGDFTNCTFEKSILAGASIQGTFTGCSFLKTKLRNTVGESVSFTNCCFDGADLHGAHLCGCRFDACTWNGACFGNGSFYRSHFTGDHPRDVGNTIMDRVVGATGHSSGSADSTSSG